MGCLKVSCYVVAVVEIIFNVFVIIRAYTVGGQLLDRGLWDTDFYNGAIIIMLVICVTELIATAILLKGIYDNAPRMFLFWLGYNFLLNVLLTIGIIIIFNRSGPVMILVMVYVLAWVMWAVVLEYYKKLNTKENNVQTFTPTPV